MRSTKLLACLATCASALALSCARGVSPDAEDTAEPGAASTSTEDPARSDDAEEDAGREEVAGTGEESDEEDEDRARDEDDVPNGAERTDRVDAGLGVAQQAGDVDAGGVLDAGDAASVDAGSRVIETDAAEARTTELDAATEDAGATVSEDAAISAAPTPDEAEPSPTTRETSPPEPADESQLPEPTPVEEPVAPPASESSACANFSDCAQPCFPLGLLACCRADGSCGCTWAPGAYCL